MNKSLFGFYFVKRLYPSLHTICKPKIYKIETNEEIPKSLVFKKLLGASPISEEITE